MGLLLFMRARIDPNHHKGIIVTEDTSGEALDVTGADLTNSNPMHVALVDGSGSQITAFSGKIAGVDYDYIDVQQTSATVETYVYKTGGSGGTTIQTIVVTYTDATKADIDTVVYS